MKTKEELKQLAIDLAEEKIFTNQHLNSALEVSKYFTAFNFLSESEILKLANDNPGLIFEYKDQAIGCDSDGDPIFKEFQILDKDEAIMLFHFFDEYKREKTGYNESLFDYKTCVDLLTGYTFIAFENNESYINSLFYTLSNFKGKLLFKGNHKEISFSGDLETFKKYSKRFLKYKDIGNNNLFPIKYDELSAQAVCADDVQSIQSILDSISGRDVKYSWFIIIKND